MQARRVNVEGRRERERGKGGACSLSLSLSSPYTHPCRYLNTRPRSSCGCWSSRCSSATGSSLETKFFELRAPFDWDWKYLDVMFAISRWWDREDFSSCEFLWLFTLENYLVLFGFLFSIRLGWFWFEIKRDREKIFPNVINIVKLKKTNIDSMSQAPSSSSPRFFIWSYQRDTCEAWRDCNLGGTPICLMHLSGQIYRRIVKNSGESIALVERFEIWSRLVINCHVLFDGCWWSWKKKKKKKKGITLTESKFIYLTVEKNIYIYINSCNRQNLYRRYPKWGMKIFSHSIHFRIAKN